MNKTLLIVESPTKATKIQEYLGSDYIVVACKGHIADLAKGGKFGMGVDIAHDFAPKYVLNEDKIEVLDNIMKLSKQCSHIIIASDEDREGEAIAWHLSQRLAEMGKPIKRMVFNEIKKAKIQKALQELRDVDLDLFHAQEARRILDRLVGFTASPFLMNFFGPKLSAGRVQSVVTRMVIDREREIEAFVPETFWTIQVSLADKDQSFIAKFNGKLTDLPTATQTKKTLSHPDYLVESVIAEEEKKFPQAPLVTSTLQRLMSKNQGFSADRTMKAAQALYESGYCTYIRTDSVRASDESIAELRQWLADNQHSVPKKISHYKNKEAIQDAHECIRPSDLNLIPNQNYAIIDPDEKAVYAAIWKSFVASQMMPAIYDTLTVVAHPANATACKVKASGKALKSKGFLDILGIVDDSIIDIPNLQKGQSIYLTQDKNAVKMEKKQTQPPPRYSEDKLIKELVNRNIGRPATFAELLSKISTRNYVEKKGNVFHATDLGKIITDELKKYFTFVDYDYSAKMEVQLDEVESGKINHIDMLKKFYPDYKEQLKTAYLQHGSALCELCDSPMVIRTAKVNGSKFLACTAYPRCKHSKQIKNNSL